MKCHLCDNEIPNDEAEDYYCYGCTKYICEEHYGDPRFGEHEPEDHEEE